MRGELTPSDLPPPPDPPAFPGWFDGNGFCCDPPEPPPVDVIVEKTEFDPLLPFGNPGLSAGVVPVTPAPPAPTVIE